MQTYRHTDIQTYIHTYMYACIHTYTDRQAGRLTDCLSVCVCLCLSVSVCVCLCLSSSDPESHPKVGFKSVSGFGFRRLKLTFAVGFGFRVSGFGFRRLKPTFAVGFGFRVSYRSKPPLDSPVRGRLTSPKCRSPCSRQKTRAVSDKRLKRSERKNGNGLGETFQHP